VPLQLELTITDLAGGKPFAGAAVYACGQPDPDGAQAQHAQHPPSAHRRRDVEPQRNPIRGYSARI
jgi:hypothetical protein